MKDQRDLVNEISAETIKCVSICGTGTGTGTELEAEAEGGMEAEGEMEEEEEEEVVEGVAPARLF